MSHESQANSAAEFKEPFDAFDTALAASIVEGSVPEGLSERLLAALRSAARSECPAGEVREQPVALEDAPPTVGGLRAACAEHGQEEHRVDRDARRHWRGVIRGSWSPAGRCAAAGAALAAAACIVAIWAFRPLQPLSYEHLIADANAFDASLPADQWQSLGKNPPNPWYKMSSALSATRTGWQQARSFLGRNGVAYQVVSRGGAKGILYVVPLNQVGGAELQGVGKSLPARPLMTGGKATAAWTDGTRLWVLVIHGGEREYRSFRPTGWA